jgi:Na+/H+ antiporter NhaD/arsenite permease-like protein
MAIAAALMWLALLASGRPWLMAAQATARDYLELIVFLAASITFVHVLEERKLFNALRLRAASAALSYRSLFWLTGAATFVISIVVTNMVIAVAMAALVLQIGLKEPRFVTLACINIVVASNAGGAFCPFGDVTSLMLWQGGALGFSAFFKLALPALVSWLLPAAAMTLAVPPGAPSAEARSESPKHGTATVMALFAGAIALSVSLNIVWDLAPVIGMVAGLAALLAFESWQYRAMGPTIAIRSLAAMRKMEKDMLLFFLGIMFALSALAEFGWLETANHALYGNLGPAAANILIGPVSAILDNVPLVYGVLQMKPAMPESQWLLLNLAAGIGGSLLAIGSASGVALTSLAGRQYTFLKHLAWLPAIGLGYGAAVALHLMLN